METEQLENLLKKNPLLHVNKSADPDNPTLPIQENWNRYLPFSLYQNRWIPYHKTYCALWAAIKWGKGWHRSDTPTFILDLNLGTITWNNWNEKTAD